MYTAFIIFEILGIVTFVIVSLLVDEEDKNGTIAVMAISCVCFSVGIICFAVDDKPSALDVYQGNTTLEITYKDGVPIDSTVVFKNK